MGSGRDGFSVACLAMWAAILVSLSWDSARAQTPICGNGVVETSESCDDGNTADGDCCSSQCVAKTDGARCDDGLFCTTHDFCSAGICVGTDSPCTADDGVACTVATCDETSDKCTHEPDHSLCSDGVFCNGTEVCVAVGAAPGGCRPAAAPVDCSALDDACRMGVCDEERGACATEPVANPECDRDGDGVSVENDGCPYTPAGGRALFDGCAPVDIVHRPEVLLAPIGDELQEAASRLEAERSLRAIVGKLRSNAARLATVEAQLRSGRLCSGAERYERLLDSLRKSKTVLDRRLAKLTEEAMAEQVAASSVFLAPGNLAADEGDHRELDGELLRIERLGHHYSDALARALGAGRHLDAACHAVVGEFSRSGVVKEIDDTAGVLLLEDGARVALVATSPRRHVAPGVEVEINGYEMDDGIFLGDVTPTGISTQPDLELSPYTCLDLRVVPFQPYLEKPVSQMTALPLDGYRLIDSDKHAFEYRMWLTARVKDSPLCKGNGPLQYKRHTFRLSVKQDGNPTKLMAYDLAPGELALFPAGIDPGKDAFLEVTARTQNCNLLGCGPISAVSGTDTLRMGVLGLGAYCQADYESVEFQLEDKDFVIGQPTAFPQFRPATVEGILSLFLQVDPSTNPVFQAQAYEINGNASSYPNAELIGANTPFAIYQNHDFYWNYMLYPFEKTGVNDPVGLQWPRVIGLRNGEFIQYHCTTPPGLVRDVVDFCQANENSYYRMPFSPGAGNVTQGNNGSFTHNGAQAFAFDFTFQGSIRAARGGVVTFVREDIPSNSNCYNANTTPQCQNSNNPGNGCTANSVTIRHQDGTEGQYFHMPLNGVSVSQGDRVRRGDSLGQVGNTGCSSGAHLHFQSAIAPGAGQTRQIRFEQLNADCTIPPSNSTVFSNNPLY